jgi:hypothetical protein
MSASGGCGCGGSSTAVAVGNGAGCGCGSAGGCQDAGAGFARPRFFGGMLLTEDDLQATVDYAIAKRKLTNRHVLGAGVVCGLDVACHPCERGKVSVSPGYAIECCGNDIVVSCAEEVDVVALVRDLRLRQGVDCGEPCEEHPHQRYALYLRYAETPTDPVAPYATDDCATGECEFSRVREGYRFELRCDPPAAERTVLDALKSCDPHNAADTKTLTEVVQAAVGFGTAPPTEPPVPEPAPRATFPTPPTPDEFDRSGGDVPRLAEAVPLLRRAELTVALYDAKRLPSPGISEAQREAIVGRMQQLAGRLLGSSELEGMPAEERERLLKVIDAAGRPGDVSALAADEQELLKPLAPPPPAPPQPRSPAEIERGFIAGAEKIRGRILNELLASGQSACDDYRAVSRLRFTALTADSKQDAITLADAYLRSLTHCTCSALHPPCASCTDDAVVLATVRVDGCDVTDVCAVERRWIQSPRALGYWLPVVELFRQVLERACCGEVKLGEDLFKPVVDDVGDTLRAAFGTLTAATGARPEYAALLTAMGRETVAAPKPGALDVPAGPAAPGAATTSGADAVREAGAAAAAAAADAGAAKADADTAKADAGAAKSDAEAAKAEAVKALARATAADRLVKSLRLKIDELTTRLDEMSVDESPGSQA